MNLDLILVFLNLGQLESELSAQSQVLNAKEAELMATKEEVILISYSNSYFSSSRKCLGPICFYQITRTECIYTSEF